MRNKSPWWLISVIIVGIVFSIGWWLGRHNLASAPVTSAQGGANIPDITSLRQHFGLDFQPTDPTQARPTLTRDQAIAVAQQKNGQLKSTTRVDATLGRMSNPGLQQAATAGQRVDPQLANPALVWILSFQGIDTESSGPPGSVHTVSHEFNVVIDATTGQYVMDFIYR